MKISKNSVVNIISLYVVVFITILAGMSYYKATEVWQKSKQPAVILDEKIPKGTVSVPTDEDSVINNKTIFIEKEKYTLVYEKDTKKYLIFKNFNIFVGYLYLGTDESINDINSSNLAEHIEYKK